MKAKVKAIASRRSTYQSLDTLIHRLNPVLRGWTNYHRHGAASKTFAYLDAYTWRRVWLWLRTKHPKATVRDLQRRYLNRWWPEQDGVVLFSPATVAITRYRYRGGSHPGAVDDDDKIGRVARRHEVMESRMR